MFLRSHQIAYGLVSLLALCLAVSGQTINISGTVVDSASSQPVAGAAVKLLEFPQFTATTSANGTFTLAGTATSAQFAVAPPIRCESVSLRENTVAVEGALGLSQVAIDVFACNGRRIAHAEKSADIGGKVSFRNIWKSKGLYFVNAHLNGITVVAHSNPAAVEGSTAANGFAKTVATYTLEVNAPNYIVRKMTLTSTTGAVGTIKLLLLTIQPGVWTNVTPAGVNLTSDFGAQDVLADPAHPGVFYGFVCYQGVYKSVDWGVSWTHVSTDGNIEKGRPWGEAMAPDGSYMLACNGYGDNQGAWKSTDGGVTWQSHSISSDNDPYSFDIDPTNKNHVITTMHAKANVYESNDGGNTWADKGDCGGGGSGYAFFITSTTWIAISQDGNGGGTRRTVNSGAGWSNVGPMEHAHGNAQIYIDPSNNYVYVAGHGQGGVFRSTDGAASFTKISNNRGSCVFGTGNRIYSSDPGATGRTDPILQSATRSAPTSWTLMSGIPADLFNGPKRAATAYDPSIGKWVIVSGNWMAGFWRYVEP